VGVSFKELKSSLTWPVWVVALGYFVDIFDLTLFNMVRVQSLKGIGIPEDQLIDTGILLINSQMAGMLIGGFFWGVLGDRIGRLQMLFGSILLYSVANIANAFVYDVPTYVILRFIAGFGLAGELGVGITLVAEILPTKLRGYGTAFVATVGVLGATFGGLVVELFSWQTSYIIGGCLGLLLLALRIKTRESLVFSETKKQHSNVKWGKLSDLLVAHRFWRFLCCVAIGIPIWYIAGLVMGFSPELAKDLGVNGEVLSSRAIAISYLGLAVGDFLSGLLSQYLQSRKKAVAAFMAMTVLFLILLFTQAGSHDDEWFYVVAFLIGVGAGFWAIFVTVAAEQFGTNLRATVATSVPNIVRGMVIPITLSFKYLKPEFGVTQSMIIVGIVTFMISGIGLYFLPETFHKDMKYIEE
jgi:putative MFS transporter